MLTHLTIPYTDQGTYLEGFAAYSNTGKRPLVVLCHAWKGRDDFICEKAKVIASLGYVGFALDLYGQGILGKSKEENAALKKPFIEDRAFLQRRLLKSFNAACSLPNVDLTRIAVLGFGFGGLCALDLARSGVNLKGTISIHGHFEEPGNCLIQPIQAKVLILHGYNDPISSISQLQIFQQEMDKAKVDWQSHIYGNTFHGFAIPTSQDPVSGIMYNPSAAEESWKEAKQFLNTIFN